MLDIEFIRKNTKYVQDICNARGLNVDVLRLLAVDQQRRKIQTELDQILAKSNQLAMQVKEATFDEREELIESGKRLKNESIVLGELLSKIQADFQELLSGVPNLFDSNTPIGQSEDSNVELAVYGNLPNHDFAVKDHIALGNRFGMDFEAGARVAGSGFPLMRGPLARLENAILRFAYDQAVQHGYTPTSVPLMAKPEIFKGLGFNPRRNDEGTELFLLANDNLVLAGTAEIALVGQFAGEILKSDELPIKLVAMTPCFRREGAAGRRDAGLYRNKMFNKVELVTITTPDESNQVLEDILSFEINLFKQLGIHFRVIRICAGDLGAPAFKKYDLEGWMLGRGGDEDWGWGELTSCSNCTEYQARRLKIRYKESAGKPAYVHTLNGTGITTRALIPLIEQNQRADGSINIPPVLKPYLDGKDILR